MNEELVAIARGLKVRGLRGEIIAEVLTDFPARFDDMREMQALAPDGRRFTLELTGHWFQNDRVVLKCAGYDTPEQAQALVGCTFAIPEDECVALDDDEFYDWELAGCRVETITGETLGTVREVLHYGPNEVLTVKSEETGREYLIPFAAAICVEVDIAERLVRVDPPEGLLEF